MAHRILGIDLGAYSVKIAELEAGFRQAKLHGLYEKALLPALPDETELQRAARTAEALIAEQQLQAEMCTTSMRGEAILRLLSLPFSDPKKIEQVLGYELESQILTEIDELVYDSVLANPKHKDQPNPSADSPGRVIAVAAPRAEVRNIIEALAVVRAEPKIVGAAALSYAALRAPQEDELVRGIIDIGHRHTHVCVVQSSTALFARSISLGSADFTYAIMDAFKQSEEAATKLKHEHAKLVATGGTPLDQCVDAALLPLLRELKSTLAAVRATGSPAVQRLYMTGGGARLKGLLPRLEAELELPVEQLTLSVDDPFIGEGVEFEPITRAEELPGQALGLAIAAAASVPQANLRKGDLAYKVDYAFLRGKARYLLVATIAIIAFATVNAMASVRAMRKEAEGLEAQLKAQTKDLFGEERLDGAAVSAELEQGPRGGVPPIPSLTAYDILDELSHKLPTNEKGKIDLLELDIKPKKTFFKGTAGSAEQVDDIQTSLKQIDCFGEVQPGSVSTITQKPSGEAGKDEKPVELKQFNMTISTTCP